jgi:ABC-type dipeptide/oligopeptide/nickel transport system permease component
MTDQAFANMAAQIAHALAGYAAVLTLVLLGVPHAVVVACVIVTLYALVKEFWWDYKYEDAVTRGSSLEDFVFYIVGLILGIIVNVFAGVFTART